MPIFLLSVIFLYQPNFAQEPSKKQYTASEFLQMDTEESFPIVEKMTRNEAAVLITQIRQEAKQKYADIDKFYLLISHLESIRAIQEEQKRLKSLHFVYGLALFLFTAILGYVLFSQRKVIKELQNLLDS
ncbi:MAG: hypothetical protein AAF518_00260 [Spirochaetota bacterium]